MSVDHRTPAQIASQLDAVTARLSDARLTAVYRGTLEHLVTAQRLRQHDRVSDAQVLSRHLEREMDRRGLDADAIMDEVLGR